MKIMCHHNWLTVIMMYECLPPNTLTRNSRSLPNYDVDSKNKF